MVDVNINGRPEELRCTLRAARLVNAIAGPDGFAAVLRRIAAFDIETYIAVVAAGLGKKPLEVEDAVYRTGMPPLTGPISQFIEELACGGKPLDPPKEGDPRGEA